jgi:LacI family transcriptional regulator
LSILVVEAMSESPAHSFVKIDTVALAAGVSPSTVSRILNGTAVVNDAKRKAVEQAIQQLGYIPNLNARGLAGGRSLSVGVVTQALDSPFYGTALRGIEDELEKTNYQCLFTSGHWDAKAEARCIETLRSRRVDGIIVLTGRLSNQMLKNYAKALPIVITGRELAATGIASLKFDDYQGALLAVQHLIDLGHRRIAFIAGHPQHPDSKERLQAYKDALAAADIAYDPALFAQGNYSEDSGQAATAALLSQRTPFTALFASNDQMAFGAAVALHRQGLRVPDDISLVGFDDLPNSPYVVPPLTTVHQPAYELGQLAAQAMLQLLSGKAHDGVVPAPRLVCRQSTRTLALASSH